MLLAVAGGSAARAQVPDSTAAPPVGGSEAARPAAYAAELRIDEPGFDAGLRLRLYHQPDLLDVPDHLGTLFLVMADSASGRDAFFIASDLAFELGETQVYRVEFEQASDPFGQLLGGKLPEGKAQLGFVLVPRGASFDRYLPAAPESVTVRYAHHRAPLRPATEAEREEWTSLVTPEVAATALNRWWEWAQAMSEAPPMSEGELRFLAERIFPGQGHVLQQEGVSAGALRNAILRVGERRLLEGPARLRVAPRYPAAARQAGVGGLVIALCYVNPDGRIADAAVLATNTVHLLNLAALSAAMEWQFPRVKGPDGEWLDGWRLLPFQFLLPAEASAAASADTTGAGYEPPRIGKYVEPEYPERARQKRIEGTVVYRVTVNPRGKLVQAVLEQSVHPLVDQAALEALEQMLFIPGTRHGVPVASEISVPFTFGELD